ncbi:MAG: cytidylate kinase-like family protein [Eubacterium sp.]|nr:cytidylate kinase-like family protein [Eubacterium sp.]
MGRFVIVINREYGSGGRTIGQMLAEELGIPWYNIDLERFASEQSGISETFFAELNDRTKPVRPYLLNNVVDLKREPSPPGSSDYTSENNLILHQAGAIRRIAEKENCVIIGHGGVFSLEDTDYAVRVFVHAPKEFLLEQAALKKSLPPAELEKYVMMINRNREEFYKKFTGQSWSDARNYDLCINTGKLGFERGVEIIKGYLRIRFPEETF